ncbi:hypothetical protein MHYP_G00293280 [Metynnis hypsauchen]
MHFAYFKLCGFLNAVKILKKPVKRIKTARSLRLRRLWERISGGKGKFGPLPAAGGPPCSHPVPPELCPSLGENRAGLESGGKRI